MKRLLPAYPLFVKDPYFSLWSPSDEPNGSDVIFWTGHEKKTYGLVTFERKTYSFLGMFPGAVKLKTTDARLTAFSTEYDFSCDEFDLTVRFVSPLPPDDLEMLSCPVCFLEYALKPKKAVETVCVSLSLSDSHCCDIKTRPGLNDEDIAGGVIGANTAWFGLRRQAPLSQSGDMCSADWGYFHLDGQEAYYHTAGAFPYIFKGGAKPYLPGAGVKYITALDRHNGGGGEVRGVLRIAFDDVQSINYFGDYMKGWYFRNGKTVLDALSEARESMNAVYAADERYTKIIKDGAAAYGDAYGRLLTASLRQSIAAHKLSGNNKTGLLFFSKECYSNGCTATVDVSYPSMPLYLLLNPELLRGMLEPIFKFARMPAWEYDFAPHDAGCYPNCIGQAYGMNGCETVNADVFPHAEKQGVFYPLHQYPAGQNLYKYEDQMPVEECANMLIMSALYFKQSALADTGFLKRNFRLLNRWAKHLIKYGLVPAKQLCTDDFAGRIGKNVNLSIKASVGIAAFAQICRALGKPAEAEKADKLARGHADKLVKMFKDTPYTPLAMDMPEDSFSLKYNLAADILLESGLYPKEFAEREIKHYLSVKNAYGVPLDSRKTYSKTDWLLWTAACASNKEDARALFDPIAAYLEKTPDRVPFSDWFDTETARQSGFQNRTVQGAMFILMSNSIKERLE